MGRPKVFLTFLFLTVAAICPDASGGSDFLNKGIELYKQEDFEESVAFLVKAREQEPTSSIAAFFLGMAYKQIMDYSKALPHLKDAVTLVPKIKDALVELIFVYQQLGKPDDAEKWIQVAEKENIFPAKTAFLKGMVCFDNARNTEAIASFENAKTLDPSLSQASEYWIALCYLRERNLKAAKERLAATILFDPQSDLSDFARQYLDSVTKGLEREKPFRMTLGMFGLYDTNVVLKPNQSEVASNITDEKSLTMTNSFRMDYVPILKGPWIFSAQYAVSSNVHQKHSTSHDVLTNSFNIAPGYDFGRFSLNLIGRYSHSLLRGPNYGKYLGDMSGGLLFRSQVEQNHFFELFQGYHAKKYFQAPLIAEEDRNSTGISMYLSWICLYGDAAFFNLRYQFSDEDAHGDNWDNHGHRISLNTVLPLGETLRLQLGGDAFFQNYGNTHTSLGTRREDDIYQMSAGLTWEFMRNTQLILQYARTRADSNLAIYDYQRNLYTAGLELRF